jgi:K(+)-stimulated pyrophosphate-energized sodium pump
MNLYMSCAFVICGGVLALLYAWYKTSWIFKQPVEDENLKRISGYVAEGAMAFLAREYKALVWFVALVAFLLVIGNKGAHKWQALAFVVGATCSGLAGFFGMKVATAANSRTTNAARKDLNSALQVAFSGGSVMGMCVVGLALVGIGSVFALTLKLFGSTPEILQEVGLPVLAGFSLGASSIALFARVGGGIFTKAADVGADLVGKVEAGIPEDDPRNPATIADNVGDNVGDVAGMGADLFESYVGSIIGAMILGVAATVAEGSMVNIKLVGLPLLLAAMGVVAAILGVNFVRCKPGADPQKALHAGSLGAAGLAALLTYPITSFVMQGETFIIREGLEAGALQIFLASIMGLVSGLAIGFITEHYTGTHTKPVNEIVKACATGPATTLITGMGVGMMSAGPSIAVICVAILGSHYVAGLYGIAVAALGMLVTLGIQLAVDAYGPIADNAGGLAEMSEFPPEVREITDKLDAVGNTTAAIGKGFAIGSAALTAIILFNAYQEQSGASSIVLNDPKVLVGVLFGAVIPYIFSSLAMKAVGRAAFAMIEEVRRQFRTIPGLLQGEAEPEYARCVEISTVAALKEMMLPGLLAAATPVVVGFIGGIDMLAGLLGGVTASGVVLAIFMSNSGGAWDNAKKMIEEGAEGGKGSDAHKAAVVGDTVGDPFKDTAGPSLNILIKLIVVVSLVIAPMLKAWHG